MPQFTVYRNKNPQTLSVVPFLLDVQHDLLSDLETRVVIPLRSVSTNHRRTWSGSMNGEMQFKNIESEIYICNNS